MRPWTVSLALVLWIAGTGKAGYAPKESPELPESWYVRASPSISTPGHTALPHAPSLVVLYSGWGVHRCSETHGTVTRSTAECMCRERCEGPKCRSGQGMVWYSFKECPEGCKCVPHVRAQREESPQQGQSHDVFGVEGPVHEGCAPEKPCADASEADAPSDPTANAKSVQSQQQSHASGGGSDGGREPTQQMEEYGADDDGMYDDEYETPADARGEEEEDEEVSTVEALLDFVDENGRAIFGIAIVLMLSCVCAPLLMLVPRGGADAAATAVPVPPHATSKLPKKLGPTSDNSKASATSSKAT